MENNTMMREFIILGFSDLPELQSPLFLLFFLVYMSIVIGNLLIMTLIYIDHRLHTPMYFFLSNLSFLDISYTSDIFPKMLAIFLTGNKKISFAGCLLQVYLFLSFGGSEFLLLASMAYDRYIAICHPMRYMLIMNKKVCILLAASSWVIGFLDPIMHIVILSHSYFCGSNEIDHFFCDLTPLMKLSCSSVDLIEVLTYVTGALVGMTSFSLTLMSYTYIISTILKMHSVEGRHKAFSTCSSHLTVVILFYGTLMCMYMRPSSMYSLDQNKLISVLYIALIPLLNPFIYSLKNKDVKSALQKVRHQNNRVNKINHFALLR